MKMFCKGFHGKMKYCKVGNRPSGLVKQIVMTDRQTYINETCLPSFLPSHESPHGKPVIPHKAESSGTTGVRATPAQSRTRRPPFSLRSKLSNLQLLNCPRSHSGCRMAKKKRSCILHLSCSPPLTSPDPRHQSRHKAHIANYPLTRVELVAHPSF